MEAGSSSGTAPMAAPKKGALWIVIAIVIAVALTATVMDVVVFPMLKPTQSADLPKHLMTFDVGYRARTGLKAETSRPPASAPRIRLQSTRSRGSLWEERREEAHS